ncbi:magnesium transporter CorA [Streptomyces abyssalis]|uniref:Magnesium transport protein CorA n=1 Tax=Streptomyces abyssalis TaxID=933944 RepID=A0A1E7JUP1_9ACTN|nr:magnesium/cobalt transporter CorA [Streptomyces abyssalis]OEU89381.1 magnesium transporter CorA [Streptomyces abyssalis]OEU93649.1 magnesium transporter CorA [Streptomyces abyssalis]OEV29995.1 magnesium transporter CorA [Streptomyces nanshensis]
MIVDCAIYQEGRRMERPSGYSDALDEARAAGDAFLWIGLHEPTEAEFELVTSEFGLHPLAVEDALHAHQRPKLEVYEDSLFLVLKPVSYDQSAAAVSAGELMLFVGDSFVVTVRHGEANPLRAVRERLEREPEVLRHGPTAVMYAVSDAIVDQYMDVAEDLHISLDGLEEDVFSPEAQAARDTAGRIYGFKRQVLGFRRATGPLADPLERLMRAGVPFVHEDSRPFFRDVSDHLTRVNEQVDSLDRLLSDILSANLAQMSVRQNDNMRKISAWAAMFAVPTAIAGIYGMNFEHMPELHWVWAYPTVLGVIVTACLLLFRLFKRRGWI